MAWKRNKYFFSRISKHDMLKALDNNNMKFERGSLQENNGFMSLSFLESVRKSINFIFS